MNNDQDHKIVCPHCGAPNGDCCGRARMRLEIADGLRHLSERQAQINKDLRDALEALLEPAKALYDLDAVGYATPGRPGDGYNKALRLLKPAVMAAEETLKRLP